jgi:hypothetical protein
MSAKPALKRELGLRDLTLFAITCVTSVRWIPIAAPSELHRFSVRTTFS